MFLTNLKIFFSSLGRQSLFTAINVLGLSVGLASCLLITLYVLDEFSFDTQHPDAARIYRISSFLVGVEQAERTPIPSASPLAGPLLQANFPEVEAFTRVASEPVYLSVEEQGDYEDDVRFVDTNFFDFFQFDWLRGDAATALAEPGSIVLTQSLASKYFGTMDPVGRELQLSKAGLLKVTGVIRDLQRTHLSGTAFANVDMLRPLVGQEALETWFGARFQVYVRLREGASFAELQPQFHAFLERQMPVAASAMYDPDSASLRDIHLSEPQALGLNGSSKREELLALALVCIALLGIACINFVNLATARSSERSKEIAMRKVMGAGRGQVFLQHMGESALLVSFALLLGLGIAELALPLLNTFSGKALSLESTSSMLLALVGLGLIVTLLAGAYPALYLSAFGPAAMFKPSATTSKGGHGFRNLLVVLQFAMAIVLIVATWVIHQQVQYGKSVELGFNKDQVLVVENPLGERAATIKERWRSEAGATYVSSAMNPPFNPIATSMPARHAGKPDGESLSYFMADFDYFELFEADMIAGRSFSTSFGSDRIVQPTATDPHPSTALVLNQAMVDKLGWTPQEALGQRIELNWSEDYSLSILGNVIGVVANMRVDSLRREVVPLLYMIPANPPLAG